MSMAALLLLLQPKGWRIWLLVQGGSKEFAAKTGVI
jgi:hypothetical protein